MKGDFLSHNNRAVIDTKNDLVSMFKTQLQFYYLAPFKYGYRCIKERNYIGLGLFAAFISVLALIFV